MHSSVALLLLITTMAFHHSMVQALVQLHNQQLYFCLWSAQFANFLWRQLHFNTIVCAGVSGTLRITASAVLLHQRHAACGSVHCRCTSLMVFLHVPCSSFRDVYSLSTLSGSGNACLSGRGSYKWWRCECFSLPNSSFTKHTFMGREGWVFLRWGWFHFWTEDLHVLASCSVGSPPVSRANQ